VSLLFVSSWVSRFGRADLSAQTPALIPQSTEKNPDQRLLFYAGGGYETVHLNNFGQRDSGRRDSGR
jgi:hypothetical protein